MVKRTTSSQVHACFQTYIPMCRHPRYPQTKAVAYIQASAHMRMNALTWSRCLFLNVCAHAPRCLCLHAQMQINVLACMHTTQTDRQTDIQTDGQTLSYMHPSTWFDRLPIGFFMHPTTATETPCCHTQLERACLSRYSIGPDQY